MNALTPIALPDIQSQSDDRNIAIDHVGVKGLRYPVTVASKGGKWATVGTFSLTVGLAEAVKGTHMSRFVELIEQTSDCLTPDTLKTMVRAMLSRLDARTGTIQVNFPYFVKKADPVSGLESLLDYEVCWRGTVDATGVYTFRTCVMAPVTSLCPCSKEISVYGAHNQRSHVTIDAEILGEMAIEELLAICESAGSCQVYGLLKRADEKYVTERAYENPKFVEDLVRDLALALNRAPNIGHYIIEAENFESIHNHSAFARVERRSN